MPAEADARRFSHRAVRGTGTAATPDTPPGRRLTDVRAFAPTAAAQATSRSTSWAESRRVRVSPRGILRGSLPRKRATSSRFSAEVRGAGSGTAASGSSAAQPRTAPASSSAAAEHGELGQEQQARPPAPPPGEPRPGAEQDAGARHEQLERPGPGPRPAGGKDGTRQGQREHERRQRHPQAPREPPSPVGKRQHREEAERGEPGDLERAPVQEAPDEGHGAARRSRVEQGAAPGEARVGFERGRPQEARPGEEGEGGEEIGDTQETASLAHPIHCAPRPAGAA